MNIPSRGYLPGSQSKSAKELLPDALFNELRKLFSPRKLEYIAHVLSVDELKVLVDLHDALIIARIKRMSPQRLHRFDEFVPVDRAQLKAYEQAQLRWIKDEEYLLGVRLGRSPTPKELFADFTSNRNGLRFRAYFVLKHPQAMHRKITRHAVCCDSVAC